MSSCSASRPAADGCCGPSPVFDGASPTYKRVLSAVIAINLIGFAVVAVGSWFANSASLAANTLDFAADAATYGLTAASVDEALAAYGELGTEHPFGDRPRFKQGWCHYLAKQYGEAAQIFGERLAPRLAMSAESSSSARRPPGPSAPSGVKDSSQ